MQKKIGGLGYWDDLATTLQYKQIRLLHLVVHDCGCMSRVYQRHSSPQGSILCVSACLGVFCTKNTGGRELWQNGGNQCLCGQVIDRVLAVSWISCTSSEHPLNAVRRSNFSGLTSLRCARRWNVGCRRVRIRPCGLGFVARGWCSAWWPRHLFSTQKHQRTWKALLTFRYMHAKTTYHYPLALFRTRCARAHRGQAGHPKVWSPVCWCGWSGRCVRASDFYVVRAEVIGLVSICGTTVEPHSSVCNPPKDTYLVGSSVIVVVGREG